MRRAVPACRRRGTVCLDGVFGDEELRGDLAIAEAAGDQGEDFELACCDAEGLLAGLVLGRKVRRRRVPGPGSPGDKRFLDWTVSRIISPGTRDAKAEPNAEGREEDGVGSL